MREGLSISVELGDGRCVVALDGVLDESGGAFFDSLVDEIVGDLHLDLAKVKRINSYGIGVLMRFLSRITASRAVYFERCSEAMVDQFQMLEFSIYGRIRSFYMPYLCNRCGREDRRLVDIKRDITFREGEPILASESCTCGGELEPEDSVEFVSDHLD